MVNKQKQKGFTLVELIVVLVILDVLAALLVPALTGYIEKSRKNAVIADTRAITQAAQTELSMAYATDDFQSLKSKKKFIFASKTGTTILGYNNDEITKNAKKYYEDIVTLSEVSSLKDGKNGRFQVIADHSGVVQAVVYSNGKGYCAIYCAEDGLTEVYTNMEANVNSYFSYTGDTIQVFDVSKEWMTTPGDPYCLARMYVYASLGLLRT